MTQTPEGALLREWAEQQPPNTLLDGTNFDYVDWDTLASELLEDRELSSKSHRWQDACAYIQARRLPQ